MPRVLNSVNNKIAITVPPKPVTHPALTLKPRTKAIFFMADNCFEDVYGPEQQSTLDTQVQFIERLSKERYRELPENHIWPEVEIIVGSWGLVRLDEVFLRRFPRLKAVFYGAGSIRGLVTDAMWKKGVRITSAYAANAIPVSEFTLSQILYALKQGWRHAAEMRKQERIIWLRPPGAYHSTVGLISLGTIGRLVAKLLRSFEIRVIAFDPFVSDEEGRKLGVTMMSLGEIFAQADVVSCHAPLLSETVGLLRESHFASMREGASFLNTSRGEVVDEAGLIAVLRKRTDLTAILDVTWPEPPLPGSPLYSLPNVVLTPHIAGSVANECRRMGQTMTEELQRYLSGEPLLYEVTQERSAFLA